MTRIVHAIVRTPTTLVAVMSELAEDGRLDIIEREIVVGDTAFRDDLDVLRAHARLEGARVLDDAVRADVALVLERTVASRPMRRTPRIVLDEPVRAPRASAAHPRAYRGTKTQPPKSSRPSTIDLRPMLCHPSSTSWLGERLGLSVSTASPPWFSRLFARALVGLEALQAQRACGLATRYGLAEDEVLGAWCARLLIGHDALGFAWLEALEHVPSHLKLAFVRTVAGRAALVAPSVVGDEALRLLTCTDDVAAFERLFAIVIEAHTSKSDALYVLAATRARMLCAPWSTRPIARIVTFARDIPALVESLVPDGEPYVRLDLLDALGEVRGLAALVRSIAWSSLDHERALALRTVVLWLSYCDTMSDSEKRCRAVTRSQRVLVETLRALDDARVAVFATDLSAILDILADEARLDDGIDEALTLLARCSGRGVGHPCGAMFAPLFRLASEPRALALGAPTSSIERFLHASKRKNDRTLHAHGLHAIAERFPSLFARAFRDEPSALLRAAKWLGALEYDTRMILLRTLGAHPILERDAATRDIEALVALIDDAAGRDAGIVPRNLRLHASGDAYLRPGQLARHVAIIRASLDRARLRFLERKATVAQLAAIGQSEGARAHRLVAAHAASADENRRPLRRMLRAHLEGDRSYVLRHPATITWRREQSGLDVETWLDCTLSHTVETSRGTVRIAIEQDPLEALKLGTYVGSCLGLGGGLTYSAAAVVLDANKHVIYARTDSGEVVARQLVAVADTGRIVAYHVYGASSAELEAAFRIFDEALATLVGSSIVRGYDYFVPTILARGYWDDGSLDLDAAPKTDA